MRKLRVKKNAYSGRVLDNMARKYQCININYLLLSRSHLLPLKLVLFFPVLKSRHIFNMNFSMQNPCCYKWMENQCKTDPTCINCVHIFNAFLLWSCIGLIFYLCFTSFFSSSVQKTIIQEKTKTNEVLNIIWQNKHGVWEVQLDGITTARLRWRQWDDVMSYH